MERAPRAGLEGAAAARGAGCRCSELEPLCGEGLFSLPFCALSSRSRSGEWFLREGTEGEMRGTPLSL